MKQIKLNAPKRQELNTDVGLQNDQENGAWPEDELGAEEFKIDQFPKEFRKDHIRSTDWRFLSILILSFLLHSLFIYFLFKNLPHGEDQDFIIKIQNQFANRFLSEPRLDPGDAQLQDSELLTSAADWAKRGEDASQTETSAAKKGAPASRSSDQTDRTESSSFERRSDVRKSTADVRKEDLDSVRRDVQSIGLLGIITSGSGLISTEIVQDILSHADTASMHIKEKIQEVTRLQVPRPGVDYFGQGLGDDGNVYLESRSVKSTRTTTPGISPTDLVTNLAKSVDYKVEQNDAYQDVSNTTTSFAGLKTRHRKHYARRTARRIKETVLRHNPAIQDCYRLELKRNPALRGKVVVRITISPAGRVTYAEIIDSTIELPDFEYCIIEKIRRWNDFGVVDDVQGHVTFRHTYVFGE